MNRYISKSCTEAPTHCEYSLELFFQWSPLLVEASNSTESVPIQMNGTDGQLGVRTPISRTVKRVFILEQTNPQQLHGRASQYVKTNHNT